MTGFNSSANAGSAQPTSPTNQSTITELISGIAGDAQKLARQQFDMFKAEVREDITRTRRAAELGSAGVVLMTVGGLTLVAFLVNLLHEQFHLTMWVSCLVIGLILMAAGGIFAFSARSMFHTFNPLPDKTLNALQENLTWKTQPQPQPQM